MSSKPDSEEQKSEKRKPIRVWADGCFDVTHWGHMNALRQAKALGDQLIVGVHSDEEIELNKGPTIMNEQERYALIRSCKWVDEVIEGAPYVADLSVLDEHNIDFCVHGEDITTDASGVDAYAAVKEAGRYRTISRTEGVSTTDIVGRMILRTTDHMSSLGKDTDPLPSSQMVDTDTGCPVESPYTRITGFFPSAQRIVQFSDGQRSPTKEDEIIYIDGSFDLFHIGHVAALETAKAMGTYLIVGLHNDEVVNSIKGRHLPIMNIHERVLSVLACKHVDDVIIGAPWQVTEEMIEQLRIKHVAQGSFADYPPNAPDPYEVPKKLGIFKKFESKHTHITSDTILQRIYENLTKYQKRNQVKQQSEVDYIAAHEEEGTSAEKS